MHLPYVFQGMGNLVFFDRELKKVHQLAVSDSVSHLLVAVQPYATGCVWFLTSGSSRIRCVLWWGGGGGGGGGGGYVSAASVAL